MKGFLKFENALLRTRKILKDLLITKLQDFFLIALLPILIFNIVIFHEVNKSVERVIQHSKLLSSPIAHNVPAPYPTLRSQATPLTSSITQMLEGPISIISANAAIVLDKDSHVILFSKNPTLIFPMASTTKIMTALVALEYYKKDSIVTVGPLKVPPAVVGVEEGQKFYIKDILYGLMLPSGNDAAMVIAQNYPGGVPAFVEAMNQKARQLNLINTHFADPSGLSEFNTTTAFDLSQLSLHLLDNPFLAQIVATKRYVFTDVSGKETYSVSNINKLLGIDGVNGIKTGFTEEAGEVLATSRTIGGHTVVTVVMKSKNRFLDTQSILSYINKNISYIQINELLQNDIKNVRW